MSPLPWLACSLLLMVHALQPHNMPFQPGTPRFTMSLPHPHLQTCHGSGVEMKLRALGPGMVQQIQQRCSRCGGGGYSCPPADKCGQCDGKGLAPEKKVFEVRPHRQGCIDYGSHERSHELS